MTRTPEELAARIKQADFDDLAEVARELWLAYLATEPTEFWIRCRLAGLTREEVRRCMASLAQRDREVNQQGKP